MKKIIITLMAAAMAWSCNKEMTGLQGNVPSEKQDSITEENPGIRHEVKVRIGQTLNAAAVAESDLNEDKINDVQIFAFRKGELDAYSAAEGTEGLTISCTSGERTFYVLANAAPCQNITTESGLLAVMSDFKDNHMKNFIMTGKTTATVPETSSVSIGLDRIGARIVVKGITKAFDAPALAGQDFTVDKIYLINLTESVNYGTDKRTGWYSLGSDKSGSELGGTPGTAGELVSKVLSAKINNGTPYTETQKFYAYPNNNGENTTKLVLETTLGTRKYYYPISLPALDRNRSYEIDNITITRPGSDTPDQNVTSDEIQVSIKVKDWTVVKVTEGTTI